MNLNFLHNILFFLTQKLPYALPLFWSTREIQCTKVLRICNVVYKAIVMHNKEAMFNYDP